MLLLAPRHPERWADVADLVESKGLSLLRRTDLDSRGRPPDVLLLDSLGELATLYQIGIGCFIGGTLVSTGGHNPLEAAVHGVAISVGPSMENFRDIALAFDRERAWQRVESVETLAAAWESWILEPEKAAELGLRGAQIVAANQGSLATTTAMLETLIEEPPAAGHSSEDAFS